MIFNRVRSLFLEADFLKNLSILAGGTLLNQVLLFAVTPILSRLYNPFQFGLLAVFTSVATILSIPLTAKLENAIVLPKEEIEAFKIAKLGFLVATVVSSIILVFIIGFYMVSPFEWIYFLTIPCAYLMGIFNIMMFSLHRMLQYSLVSKYLIIQTIVLISANLICGVLKVDFGLIFAYLSGYFFITILLVIRIKKTWSKFSIFSLDVREFVSVLKKYSSFYKFYLPFQLATVGGQSLVPLFLGFFYNVSVVGFFSISSRILRAPFLLFVGSIGNIFKNDATRVFKNNFAEILVLFRKTFFRLLIISFVTFSAIAILCDYFFPKFLGVEWNDAIIYARILCVSLFIEIIEVPLSFIYTLLSRQKIQFLLQTTNIFFALLALSISGVLKISPIYSVALFAGVNSLFNIYSIWYSYYILRNYNK